MLTLYVPEFASVRRVRCSPPSWMLMLALAEKGVPFELRELDYSKGEQKTDAMLELNPAGTIPVLEHGAVVMTESLAMMLYVDEAFEGPRLLPPEAAERGPALDRFLSAAKIKDAGMAMLVAAMQSDAEDPALAETRAAFVGECQNWARHLPDLKLDPPEPAAWVVFTYLAAARYLGLDLLVAYQPLFEAMRSRDSVQRAWPESWAEPGDPVLKG